MSIVSRLYASQGDPGGTVIILNSNFNTIGLFSGPSYSGVRFSIDGNMYRRQAAGGWSSIGAWLLKGAASDYYVQRTVESGTLTADGGDGAQLTTDRTYDIQQPAPFEALAALVTFELSTDAPGTSVEAGPTALSFNTFWETGA